MSTRKGLLERLADGPVVGDGSFVMTLEKRGYVLAGNWTPEASVQYPEAVRQLHREFLRAGADVLQTFTFYASEDRMNIKQLTGENSLGWETVNNASCDLAREVANEGNALVAGSLTEVCAYEEGKERDEVESQFRKQCELFAKKRVDFLIGEFFSHTEEAEWAVEVMKEFGLPVACTMRMSLDGDKKGVKPGEAAVRLAKAGADVVGVNCCYDPDISLGVVAEMKAGLEEAGLTGTYLMVQPVGFHSQELVKEPYGYTSLPEFPFALEPRALTRIDVQKYARRAYEMGVRYIGGCCGFEPHHVRAIAQELKAERGRDIPGKDKSEGPVGLARSGVPNQFKRTNDEYWLNLRPAAGREWIRTLAELDPDK